MLNLEDLDLLIEAVEGYRSNIGASYTMAGQFIEMIASELPAEAQDEIRDQLLEKGRKGSAKQDDLVLLQGKLIQLRKKMITHGAAEMLRRGE